MASNSSGKNGDGGDLWSQIVAGEDQQQRPKIGVTYKRRKQPQITPTFVHTNQLYPSQVNRTSLAAITASGKRVSWNRALSTRGRTSIAATACVNYQPEPKKGKRKPKPPLPKVRSFLSRIRLDLIYPQFCVMLLLVYPEEVLSSTPQGKSVQTYNLDKERAYFKEVDSFELMEESPSPKSFGTWTKSDDISLPHLSSVIEKWLITKKLNYSYGPSGSLSKILETPGVPVEPICFKGLEFSELKTPEKASGLHSIQKRFSAANKGNLDLQLLSENHDGDTMIIDQEVHEDIEASVRKLSLTSHWDPFQALLNFCGQATPLKFLEVLSEYCEPESIVKLGEGTYGEAFKTGKTVCKIVPVDGDIQVNGADQKKSEELLEEVILSQTLNRLRGHGDHNGNLCTTFIGAVGFKVCQGIYDPALLQAWEAWDGIHTSENDHPKEFPENQCYVVLVQEHGGRDLESFVLLNFDEAQSLLVQTTVALGVAEAAFEFEHRDLHWGNVLLSRKESETLPFTLDGKPMHVKTNGLCISIIDFTLSRMNTGEDILYLDLSLDQELFEGPKGDRQSETYRKMKEITEDCWEGSFPKTNVVWLQYLVDILLLKKSFVRTSKDERELRSFKKRLNSYNSAKEAIGDPFLKDLIDYDI